MIADTQKRAAEAIVNIFETGSARGDYANVTVVANDPGHLTYGRSQTTLASGNLYLLLNAYVAAPGAAFAAQIEPFLPRLRARDLSLDHDMTLRRLLRDAGADPVMEAEQDAFFDRVYWMPAIAKAQKLSITTALGCCTVYDSTVHGSFELIRDRTNQTIGPVGPSVDERSWITRYIALRRDWLANSSNKLLRKTVYRPDALQSIAKSGNWDLNVPLTVRGVVIDDGITGGPPIRISALVVEHRLLMLTEPNLLGEDVAELQRALQARVTVTMTLDGIFGPETDAALRTLQHELGLIVDGIAGPATRAALGM